MTKTQIKLLYFILHILFSKKINRSTFIEYNKPDPRLQSADSLTVFKKSY